MSNIVASGLVRGIGSFASSIGQGLMERNEAVIRLRKKFDLDHEHLPDKFGVVYQYTLIEYGVGKEEILIEIFEQEEIQKAFRSEFEKNKAEALENAVKELINWEYLDWNTLGADVKEKVKELDIDLKQEIEDFRKAFYKVLPRTFKPSQIQQNKDIQKILYKIEKLNDLEEIQENLKEAIQLIKKVLPEWLW